MESIPGKIHACFLDVDYLNYHLHVDGIHVSVYEIHHHVHGHECGIGHDTSSKTPEALKKEASQQHQIRKKQR